MERNLVLKCQKVYIKKMSKIVLEVHRLRIKDTILAKQ